MERVFRIVKLIEALHFTQNKIPLSVDQHSGKILVSLRFMILMVLRILYFHVCFILSFFAID